MKTASKNDALEAGMLIFQALNKSFTYKEEPGPDGPISNSRSLDEPLLVDTTKTLPYIPLYWEIKAQDREALPNSNWQIRGSARSLELQLFQNMKPNASGPPGDIYIHGDRTAYIRKVPNEWFNTPLFPIPMSAVLKIYNLYYGGASSANIVMRQALSNLSTNSGNLSSICRLFDEGSGPYMWSKPYFNNTQRGVTIYVHKQHLPTHIRKNFNHPTANSLAFSFANLLKVESAVHEEVYNTVNLEDYSRRWRYSIKRLSFHALSVMVDYKMI